MKYVAVRGDSSSSGPCRHPIIKWPGVICLQATARARECNRTSSGCVTQLRLAWPRCPLLLAPSRLPSSNRQHQRAKCRGPSSWEVLGSLVSTYRLQ